jgi:hypothetical protein
VLRTKCLGTWHKAIRRNFMGQVPSLISLGQALPRDVVPNDFWGKKSMQARRASVVLARCLFELEATTNHSSWLHDQTDHFPLLTSPPVWTLGAKKVIDIGITRHSVGREWEVSPVTEMHAQRMCC